MPTATFSVLKRNRSSSTTKTSNPPEEKARRHSTRGSGDARHGSLNHRRPSLSSFFQNLLGDERRNKFSHDSSYEYMRYRKASLAHSQSDKISTHIMPTVLLDNETTPVVPQSILIKRESSVNDSRTLPRESNLLTSPCRSTLSQRRRSSSQHLRQSSFISSSMTVNSENLTAKEFADIAGIRILSDSESTNSNEDMDGDECCECDSTSIQSRHLQSSVHSCSSLHSHDNKSFSSGRTRKPQIWDNEFWQRPDGKHSDKTQPQSTKGKECLVDELRRVNTRSSDRLSCTERRPSRRCVIRKGRFEIQLETADSMDDQIVPTIITTTHNVSDPATSSSL